MGIDMSPSDSKWFTKTHEKAKSDPKFRKEMAKKMGSAFDKQQDKIRKERSEHKAKHPGTFMGRPKHELEKESGR